MIVLTLDPIRLLGVAVLALVGLTLLIIYLIDVIKAAARKRRKRKGHDQGN